MQTSFNNTVPIELQTHLDNLRELARKQNVSEETLLILKTRMWVAFLRTLWPAGCVPPLKVDWLNTQCPEFQINVQLVQQPGVRTTVMTHITPAKPITLHDGSFLAFVRRLTLWVWKRIQTHRVEWFNQTPEGLVLQEATQRLRCTLDRAYAEFNRTQDHRIYPQGKVGDFFGASVSNRWTDDLRSELWQHARMFSFADFKIVLHPNRRLSTTDALEETRHSCGELTRILARADEDLNASLAHWRAHYEGAPCTEDEENDHCTAAENDHCTAAEYELYHIPALRGSKYGRKLRTGQ
jgi:hypothetical protein